MKKKALALLLASAMVLSMAACGDDSSGESGSGSVSGSATPDSSAPESSAPEGDGGSEESAKS